MAKTELTGKQIKDQSVDLAVDVTGILPVINGGSGCDTVPLNNVVLGNGTGAFQTVPPGTNGNILTSNGSTWTSAPSSVVGVTGDTGPAGPIGPKGDTGAVGPTIDNIVAVNDSLQFYVSGNAVGSPVVVPGAVIDGGSPTSTSENLVDGGTL